MCAARAALLLVLAAAAAAGSQEQARPLVTVESGALRGLIQRSLSGRHYAAFKGVPYAEPPVGALRFEPPVPHGAWSGERDASAHGANCLQYSMMHNFSKRPLPLLLKMVSVVFLKRSAYSALPCIKTPS